jgi:hypothetical protein
MIKKINGGTKMKRMQALWPAILAGLLCTAGRCDDKPPASGKEEEETAREEATGTDSEIEEETGDDTGTGYPDDTESQVDDTGTAVEDETDSETFGDTESQEVGDTESETGDDTGTAPVADSDTVPGDETDSLILETDTPPPDTGDSDTAKEPLTFYSAPIEYRETMTRIVGIEDVAWSPDDLEWHQFEVIRASADGSKVVFVVDCEFCSDGTTTYRPFIADADGSGIADMSSSIYPADIVSVRWSWGSLGVNDDGSRVFIRAQENETGQNFYYYDVASGETYNALANPFAYLEMTIDGPGERMFFQPFDAGYDETLERARKGLFSAGLGGDPGQYLDLVDLPCGIEDCSSNFDALNYLSYIGASADGSSAFFAWSTTQGGANNWGIYRVGVADGGVTRLTGGEHYWVLGDINPWGLSSENGGRVLATYIHTEEEQRVLTVVETDTNTEIPITSTPHLANPWTAAITRSGEHVLVNGDSGEYGFHRFTLMNVDSGAERDTWSRVIASPWSVTGVTADDSRYFFIFEDGVFRVDMGSGSTSAAPDIQDIAFSATSLADQDDVTVAVEVTVYGSSPENIDGVWLYPLIEGRESPPWYMGRAPLAFPATDADTVRLVDDGTSGDREPGDGVFTFDAIATRKGAREEGDMNTWFGHYPLPAELGIRVVARDLAGHYAIADTNLLITE